MVRRAGPFSRELSRNLELRYRASTKWQRLSRAIVTGHAPHQPRLDWQMWKLRNHGSTGFAATEGYWYKEEAGNCRQLEPRSEMEALG
jgi:hypothetical protein